MRKRGSLGVVSWVSLLARFALLLISDQDDVSRCQQVRLIVSRLFLTRKSARNDPRVIRHIGFPSTRLLSLFPSLFSRDEVIDIFHGKNRGCMQRISYLRLGCIKGWELSIISADLIPLIRSYIDFLCFLFRCCIFVICVLYHRRRVCQNFLI